MRKKPRRLKNGMRLHLISEESSGGRTKRKLLGKTLWYKDRKRNEDDVCTQQGNVGGSGRKDTRGSKKVKTRSVIFVEQTPLGELSRRMKDQLHRLELTLGYRMKVFQRTGRSITSIFAQTAIWQGVHCEREQCLTCN